MTNTHKMTTIHTIQLQQYTWPTNNNYTQDNLKLATMLSLSTTQPYAVTVVDIDITFSIQILTTSFFVVTIDQI